MRRALLAALVLLACDHPSARSRVPVIQKTLRAEPMFFHPDLPIVGQIEGARCDIWDLSSTLYRGTVEADACGSWASPRPELPPDIVAATLEMRIELDPRSDGADAGAVIGARSIDGRWLATARKLGREARLWHAASLKFERVVAIAVADRGRIEDLMWTRAGTLVLATDGDGPKLWNPAEPEKPPRSVAGHAADEYERSFVDPAGRYLGVTGRGYRKPFSLRFAGVMTFVDDRAKELLASERLDDHPTIRSAAFAASRASAFVQEDRPSGDLDLCGRDEAAVVAMDPEKGLARLVVDAGRVVSVLDPAPDGRRALVRTGDAPLAIRCDGAQSAAAPEDRGPLLQLWEPAAGAARVISRAPVTAVAWAAASDRFAVVTGGRVDLFDAGSPSTITSWDGHEPLAITADGRIGFDDNRGFALHSTDAAQPTIRFDVPAVAVAVTGDRIALATKQAVEVWSIHPPRLISTISATHVSRLAWSPAGASLLMTTEFHHVLLQRLDQESAQEIADVVASSVLGWMLTEESFLVRSPDAILHFGWQSGEWRQILTQPLDKTFFVDPTGRYAVSALDLALSTDAPLLRRLSDGQTLYLDDQHPGRILSSEGAFTGAPPEALAFRLGSSVLESPIVRAAEATFALPIPDLGERFAREGSLSTHR